jgi:hypothetical protein
MNLMMKGDHAVPILVDHTTVYKEPQIKRTRKFVGLREGLKALAAKAVDVVLDSFWETEQEILDAGRHESTGYAIEILDTPGQEVPELIVTRLDGKGRPGCGIYLNIIKAEKEDPKAPAPPIQPESKAKLVSAKAPRPHGHTAPASILSRLANPEQEGKSGV